MILMDRMTRKDLIIGVLVILFAAMTASIATAKTPEGEIAFV